MGPQSDTTMSTTFMDGPKPNPPWSKCFAYSMLSPKCVPNGHSMSTFLRPKLSLVYLRCLSDLSLHSDLTWFFHPAPSGVGCSKGWAAPGVIPVRDLPVVQEGRWDQSSRRRWGGSVQGWAGAVLPWFPCNKSLLHVITVIKTSRPYCF